MKDIILASGSPRRRELLTRLGLVFTIIPAEIEEDITALQQPEDLVRKIAFQKACYVSKRLNQGLIISADTIVVLAGQVLGKPVSETDAFEKLRMLSGKCHEVITGVCVMDVDSGNIQLESETTRVFFREISDQEINLYIAAGECLDKAGAYGIQGLGSLFVDRIEGCYYNVVGLPLTRLYLMLVKQGVNLLGG